MITKGFLVDENMSNLTSASGEISASSGATTRNDSSAGSLYLQQSSTSTNQPQPKRKRSLPGNPDPDAEVIALSPTTLLATNRFICEICNKGFKRDQNLQLHRRGHNLPWKLKQRNRKEIIRKKVYACPELTCIHHDPSRALGDLTGIKKHFSRKHGEKKWKCEKCSKRYAVQSDWKAHSKVCGTREYRCNCGTLFSRRDSFITHRAFCDALAQESGRAITAMNPLLSSRTQLNPLLLSSVKKEQRQQLFDLRPEISPWQQLSYPSIGGDDHHNQAAGRGLQPLSFPSPLLADDHQSLFVIQHHDDDQNPNPNTLLPSSFQPTASPRMSATALLQKASQLGVTTMTKPSPPSVPAMLSSTPPQHHQAHIPNCSLVHNMIGTSNLPSGFEGSSLEEAMHWMLNQTSSRDHTSSNFQEILSKSSQPDMVFSKSNYKGAQDEMTRDFLGLDHHHVTSSSLHGHQNLAPNWQG
ncbi:Protein indeterminate-domain like [Quillaja saponaria]|uniref:Protein indeterminate-domain like n=1 Tax=Quillaja saponaria TaxID=32244 RepID=A0AAD7LZN9_QUISA|nr:Protein indeterminate-domain like [Quillaja saponaria]